MKHARFYTVCTRLCFILFVVYGLMFIYKTSFVEHGTRYFVLLDDAMISMKYARNLIEGNELCWNPHEKVEGFTNPVWVMYMAGIQLLGVPVEKVGLVIQLSALLFLFLNLLYVKKIAAIVSENNPLVIFAAVFLTAFYFHIQKWSLIGMEVSLVTVIITFCTFHIMRIKEHPYMRWIIYALLGFNTLVRIDMALSSSIAVCFLAYIDKPNRLKHFLYGVSVIAVCLIGQSLFRYLYYGDIFPNTYYLKMAGVHIVYRVSRGIYMFLKMIFEASWIVVLAPLAGLFFIRRVNYVFLVTLFFAQACYSMYVGGDFWEHALWNGANRFIVIVIPLLFIAFAVCFQRFFAFIGYQNRLLHCVVLGIILIDLNKTSIPQWTLLKNMQSTYEAIINVQLADKLREITLPDAKIALYLAGTVPMFLDHRYYIDLWGKNDKYIAHTDSILEPGLDRFVSFNPGHTKFDYAYSIIELSPDLITRADHIPQEYLGNYETIQLSKYFKTAVKIGSDKIDWDAVNKYK